LNSFAQSGLNFCAVAISNHFVTLRGGMTDARVSLDFFRWSQSEGNGLIHSHSLNLARAHASLNGREWGTPFGSVGNNAWFGQGFGKNKRQTNSIPLQ
jgi:hypothetical protein